MKNKEQRGTTKKIMKKHTFFFCLCPSGVLPPPSEAPRGGGGGGGFAPPEPPAARKISTKKVGSSISWCSVVFSWFSDLFRYVFSLRFLPDFLNEYPPVLLPLISLVTALCCPVMLCLVLKLFSKVHMHFHQDSECLTLAAADSPAS